VLSLDFVFIFQIGDWNMLKAKDIMTKNVITVNRNASIYDAITTLVEHHVTGLPVVDEDMTVVGIISEKDMLKKLYDVEDRAGKVDNFMTRSVVTFDHEDSIMEICNCFIHNQFRRVPILDHGKVVGIISRADIINYMLKLKSKDTVHTASATGGF
jgi:CBS domain-containing protein